MNGYRIVRLGMKWLGRGLVAVYLVGIFSLGIHGCVQKSSSMQDALMQGLLVLGGMVAIVAVAGGISLLYEWLSTKEKGV